MTAPTVLCLCCGTAHPGDTDCPNADDGKHDGERALAVARHLQTLGINHPTPEEVRDALVALGLEARDPDDVPVSR